MFPVRTHFPLDNFRERVRAGPQTVSRACASSPAARQETRIRLRRLETHPGPWRPARSIPGPRKVAAYIVGMEPTRSLEQLTDGELLLRLADILRQSRRNEADLVAHIGEVDARRLYAREASPSMYAYCTERLHLSEAEAYLRIAAARASREHPILLAMLADGRLHLTAIAKLAPHLTPDNREAVLERATHCSKRQVEEIAAELAPRPDAPALIRKLPEPPPIAPSPTSERPCPERTASSSFELRPDAVAPSEPVLRRDEATSSNPELRPDGVGAVPCRTRRGSPGERPAPRPRALPRPVHRQRRAARQAREAPGPPALLRPRRRPRRRHRRRRHREARKARGPPLRSHEGPPQEPLADRDEARLAPHPCRRPPGRARARRRPLSLRGRTGPTVHGPPRARVPPSPPHCHGW